jgi:hypothetical protein
MDLEPWSGWHSTGPHFQNRWYVWMEQGSVETLAIPLGLTDGSGAMVRLALNWTTVPEQMVCIDGTLGLTDGLWSHGQAGTQLLDHSTRTDGMYGWNRALLKL